MNLLSSTEEDILDILYEVRETFSPSSKPIPRPTFQLMMGHVRDRIAMLENKKFGCATGKHGGACECKPI